ncbi:MAG: hypothetical protein AAF696_21525 [Bacteroidota bacterium]
MKKAWKISVGILGLLIIGGIWFALTPVDLRPEYLGDKISKADYAKGKALMSQMQEAYGGMDNWLGHKTGSYVQVADWYDNKLGVAGWDELPQEFQMTSFLGSDDSELTLLNGPNTGQSWGVENSKSYKKGENGEKDFMPNEKYQHKLIYKNYWFQFPFRVSEAPIIAYAGEAKVNEKSYDLLYITWGSEAPNRSYDQYVLYLDQETKFVEWLHFTLREKVNFIHITARFADFKTINGIVSPFTQYVSFGSPGSEGPKMHENRYKWIQFGEETVMR